VLTLQALGSFSGRAGYDGTGIEEKGKKEYEEGTNFRNFILGRVRIDKSNQPTKPAATRPTRPCMGHARATNHFEIDKTTVSHSFLIDCFHSDQIPFLTYTYLRFIADTVRVRTFPGADGGGVRPPSSFPPRS
jgi:hypothetical protein